MLSDGNVNIGLLSTRDSFFLPYLIDELRNQNIKITTVILDQKGIGKESINRFRERTGYTIKKKIFNQCNYNSIKVYEVKNHNSNECINLIDNNNINLLINAGTPRILKNKIIHSSSIGVLNCHPGVLPKYRGCTCVEWAVYNNDEVGNTVHFMTESIDEGPIVRIEKVYISKKQSYYDLRAKIFYKGIKLLSDVIVDIAKVNISINDLTFQRGGKYFNVIPNENLQEVIKKIKHGNYRYQI